MSAYQLMQLFVVGYLTFLDGVICTLPVFVNYEPSFVCRTLDGLSLSSKYLKANKCSVSSENSEAHFLEVNDTTCYNITYDQRVQVRVQKNPHSF